MEVVVLGTHPHCRLRRQRIGCHDVAELQVGAGYQRQEPIHFQLDQAGSIQR